MENERTIEYSVAPLHRRFGALLVDLFCIVLTAFMLFSLSNMAFRETQWYKDNQAKREEIQAESGLYIENTLISEYYDNDEDTPIREKKDILASRILSFYSNETFCDSSAMDEYDLRRAEAVTDGVALFTVTAQSISENDVNPQYLYDFYKDEIELHALSYLASYPQYVETNQFILWSSIVQGIIYGTLSLVLFWLVIPLAAFRRGRYSLGRKLFKIAQVGMDGMSLSWWRYTLRFIFIYFVYVILGFGSFTITLIVGLSMMLLSKRNQDLAEYTLNQYSVDGRGVEIYMDVGEYLAAMDNKAKTHLRNEEIKDITNL